MNCWHCGSKMIWQSDFSYEDFGYPKDVKDGIVTILVCSECAAYAEVYLPFDGE